MEAKLVEIAMRIRELREILEITPEQQRKRLIPLSKNIFPAKTDRKIFLSPFCINAPSCLA